MATTRVYRDYGAFAQRAQKGNGISVEVLMERYHGDMAAAIADNATNDGCWDCTSSRNCTDCRHCHDSNGCAICAICGDCTDCMYCTRCEGCTGCAGCEGQDGLSDGLGIVGWEEAA